MSSESGSFSGSSGGGGTSRPPNAGHILPRRDGLTNVLIIGGTAERREQIALAFHRESPLRDGPFVRVDCSLEEDLLCTALEGWVGAGVDSNPYREAERGTLYLDPVGQLSAETQGLLLELARRLQGQPPRTPEAKCAARLVTGNPTELADAVSEGRFMAALRDALDKVRVQLEVTTPGGLA